MKKFFSLVFIGVFVFAGTAIATPSNIIRIPASDAQPFGTFHLDIDNNTTMFLPKSKGGNAAPTTYGLSAGFLDAGVLQVEAGIDVREPMNEPLSFNGKIVIPEGSINEAMPAFFFGGYDFGSEVNVTNFNIVYLGVAKTFSFIGRATFGYFFGNGNILKDKNGNRDNNGIMLGFDTRLPKINEKLWVGIDYMATESLYGATSVGFSWSFTENAALTIAYIRYNDSTVTPAGFEGTAIRENLVSWQVDFDF